MVGGCDFSNALRPNVNCAMIIKLVGKKTVCFLVRKKKKPISLASPGANIYHSIKYKIKLGYVSVSSSF